MKYILEIKCQDSSMRWVEYTEADDALDMLNKFAVKLAMGAARNRQREEDAEAIVKEITR